MSSWRRQPQSPCAGTQLLLLGLGLGDLEAVEDTGVNEEDCLPMAVCTQKLPGCKKRSSFLPLLPHFWSEA